MPIGPYGLQISKAIRRFLSLISPIWEPAGGWGPSNRLVETYTMVERMFWTTEAFGMYRMYCKSPKCSLCQCSHQHLLTCCTRAVPSSWMSARSASFPLFVCLWRGQTFGTTHKKYLGMTIMITTGQNLFPATVCNDTVTTLTSQPPVSQQSAPCVSEFPWPSRHMLSSLMTFSIVSHDSPLQVNYSNFNP